jgi:hypothetical protein
MRSAASAPAIAPWDARTRRHRPWTNQNACVWLSGRHVLQYINSCQCHCIPSGRADGSAVSMFSESTVILASKRFSWGANQRLFTLRTYAVRYTLRRDDRERAAPWLFDNTVFEMPATGTEPSEPSFVFQQPRDSERSVVGNPQAALDYEEPFHSTGASGGLKRKKKTRRTRRIIPAV